MTQLTNENTAQPNWRIMFVSGGWCLRIIPISCQTLPGAVNDKWYWRCLANALALSPRTDSTTKCFKILHGGGNAWS